MHQDGLKEKDEFILLLKIVLGQIAWQRNEKILPQTVTTTFAFGSVFILLLWFHLTLDDAGPWWVQLATRNNCERTDFMAAQMRQKTSYIVTLSLSFCCVKFLLV